MLNVNNRKKDIYCISIFLYTVMMSLVCVGSSPFLDYMDPDSQNFRLIGRALAAGQIAYRDIFDHKGPYIFFINELGAMLSSSSEMGIFLIEIVEYFINTVIVYKIASRFVDKRAALLSSMAFLGVFFNFFTFVTGDLTDSHSVFFQLISVYLIVDYSFKSESDVSHPPIYMMIHGICATCVGMMRPNNAGMWIAFGVVLAFNLFSNKKFVNFFTNLLFLIIGVLLGFVPYLYYGIRYNCFEEMWYGMFTANFAYTSNNASIARIPSFIKEFVLDPSFLVVLMGIVGCVIICRYNKYLKTTYISMFVISLFFMNVSMRSDGQYNQLYMIFTIPTIIFLVNLLSKKINVVCMLIAIIIMTLAGNLQLIKQITKYGSFHYLYEAGTDIKTIMDEKPGDKVIVTGCNSVLYNVTDTLPHIKYFITYGGGLDYTNFPDATLMQMESICSLENDYVIVSYKDDMEIYGIEEIDSKINSTLSANYDIVYEKEDGMHVIMYARVE